MELLAMPGLPFAAALTTIVIVSVSRYLLGGVSVGTR